MRTALKWWVLNSGGDSKYPLTFGDDLGLWINRRDQSTKTISNPLKILSTLTSDDPGGYAFNTTSSGAIGYGGTFFNTISTAGLASTEKAAFKFLHDGTNFDLVIEVMFTALPVTGSAGLIPIINNNGGTSARIGFGLFYDNRIASGRTNALSWIVTNGSATRNSILVNNAITPTLDQWQEIRIRRTGTTCYMYLNGVLIGQATDTGALSTSDPSDGITLFKLSNANTYATYFSIGHVVGTKRNLTSEELTGLESYFNTAVPVPGTGDIAYVVINEGQSNMEGPDGIVPPAEYQSQMDAYIIDVLNTLSTFAKLQYNVNNNAQGTGFGPNLMIGKALETLAPGKGFMLQEAVGGTSMYSDWDIIGNPGGVGGVFISTMKSVSLKILKYQMNARVKLKQVNHRQGETDSGAANPEAPDTSAITAAYKTNFTALYKGFLDAFIAEGMDTSQCKLVVSLLAYSHDLATRPYYTNINEALQDVAENFRADNPSYADKCVDGVAFSTEDLTYTDDTHFDAVSMTTQGLRFANEINI